MSVVPLAKPARSKNNMEKGSLDMESKELDHTQLAEIRRKLVGSKIREERKLKSLTQQDVVDRSNGGASIDNVRDVENSRTNDIKTIWSVCDAVGVSLALIIARTELDVEQRISEVKQGLVDPSSY